jgi:hypothetical protein
MDKSFLQMTLAEDEFCQVQQIFGNLAWERPAASGSMQILISYVNNNFPRYFEI